jgi:hypothetical protein
LCCGCHGIRLVENNQLEAGKGRVAVRYCGGHGEDLFRAYATCQSAFSSSTSMFFYFFLDLHTSKGFNLLSDNVNATVVTGIEFKNHLSHILCAVYPPGEREDGGGLAGSRRAVQK